MKIYDVKPNKIQVEEIYNWLEDDVMEITRHIVNEIGEARLENVAEHFKVDLSELREILSKHKKGKWIIDDEYIDCSVCRHEKWSRVPYEDLVKRFKFCPNCGARMEI